MRKGKDLSVGCIKFYEAYADWHVTALILIRQTITIITSRSLEVFVRIDGGRW